MKRILAVLIGSIATLGLLVGVNSVTADSATPQVKTAVITISNFAFTGELKVTPNERLKVVNADSVSHTFTNPGGNFDSGVIAAGTFKILHAPKHVGNYAIRCSIHSSMKGLLKVAKPVG